MPVTGVIPALLVGCAFALLAGWSYRRRSRTVALAPAFIALCIFVLTLTVYGDYLTHRQARYDAAVLLRSLDNPDLYFSGNLRDPRETLFLFSSASQALYRATEAAPELDSLSIPTLYRMASWVSDPDNFAQWRRGKVWQEEVYFLAHAAIVIGHYQLVSTDERFSDQFTRITRFIREQLPNEPYKHLASHPRESLLRPADNAAAVYALSLYDTYYGANTSATVRREWTEYIDRELYYAESRLPCAAFSAGNRCQLEPSAGAAGLYIAYRAAAAPGEVMTDIPYREWLHYFKRFSGLPFHLTIRPNMREGQVARQCDAGLSPLQCGRYEAAIGLWCAAEYGGGYTYFRLYCRMVFDRWFGQREDLSALRPARRVRALTEVALRAIGTWS